jgi:hypothetical protein
MTIMDGNQQLLVRREEPSGTIFDVPFYDNLGDSYTVVAFIDGGRSTRTTLMLACWVWKLRRYASVVVSAAPAITNSRNGTSVWA